MLSLEILARKEIGSKVSSKSICRSELDCRLMPEETSESLPSSTINYQLSTINYQLILSVPTDG